MIESGSGAVQEKLEALRRRYHAGLPGRLAQIKAAAERCQAMQPEDVETLHRLLHSLAGSAGVYGMPELGAEARRLEVVLKQVKPGGHAAIPPALREEIASFVVRWSSDRP
ncbi:Hpt domain-containing protein [Noviherbaspirillum humi]|uniref:Hpt domain-containing protein n=1 Tax=Noviherbaspirillum humi TaxID=1688639 RepID=A0A239K1R2_9BURK|nr:Hpt domain-containing protein [Noviherbaspirillum humi]SNT10984.1 Hpt domain-containing protein [Noviherbaspirillum humi]